MFGTEYTLCALREAVRVSPGNVPLRQHLTDTLLALGRAADVALLVIFLTGVFVSAWVANGLAMVRPKR
jgi:hypothetical protein